MNVTDLAYNLTGTSIPAVTAINTASVASLGGNSSSVIFERHSGIHLCYPVLPCAPVYLSGIAGTVSCLTILFNLINLIVIARSRLLRSKSDGVLMLSLACCDMLYGIVVAPFAVCSVVLWPNIPPAIVAVLASTCNALLQISVASIALVNFQRAALITAPFSRTNELFTENFGKLCASVWVGVLALNSVSLAEGPEGLACVQPLGPPILVNGRALVVKSLGMLVWVVSVVVIVCCQIAIFATLHRTQSRIAPSMANRCRRNAHVPSVVSISESISDLGRESIDNGPSSPGAISGASNSTTASQTGALPRSSSTPTFRRMTAVNSLTNFLTMKRFSRRSSQTISQSSTSRSSHSSSKGVVTIAIITGLFLLSMLPFGGMLAYVIAKPISLQNVNFVIFICWVNISLMLNSLMNPFVYGATNKLYKDAFVQLVSRKRYGSWS